MPDYSAIATKVVKKYTHLPNLAGIIWIGSAVHGICDQHTDIDIRLVAKDRDKPPMDQFEVDGVKIEVDAIDSDWLLEKSQSPETEQFWIRETAKILFDPNNDLGKQFSQANSIPDQTWDDLEWQLFKDLFNSYDYQKSAQRGEFITSQLYVNKTIDVLSKFIFIYHHRAVPTFKWRWHFINKDKLFDVTKIDQLLRSPDEQHQQFRLLEEIVYL